MRYYLIAGEASGDLHGSGLMKSILREDPAAEFRFYGGDMMSKTGGTLVKHYREMAFMGFVDVLANIRTITRNLRHCKKDILNFRPDALILIDYAGFNLRIAEFAHENSLRTFFYISPKVWAWKKDRIVKLKKYVDLLFVIFPFEVEYFRENNLTVEFYGNPLLDAKAEYHRNLSPDKDFRKENELSDEPVVALLAGSRKHEVSRLLPQMVKAARHFPACQFIVAGAPSIPPEQYNRYLEGTGIKVIYNQTYRLLENANAAVVTSGTATLETALFRVPQVVVFKTGWFTFYLGRLFVKIRFFSLVNLIAGREVVKELLQFRLSKEIQAELNRVLFDAGRRKDILNGYDEIINILGGEGTSERIARRICDITSGK